MIFDIFDDSYSIESLAKSDPIVDSVIAKYKQRSQVGIAKYGKTLEENKLTLLEWLNHLQEELMDATLYIEKLKSEKYTKVHPTKERSLMLLDKE